MLNLSDFEQGWRKGTHWSIDSHGSSWKTKHCYIPQHTQYSRGSRSPLKCPERGGEHGETPAYDPATAPVSPYLCHILYIECFISCMGRGVLINCHIPYLRRKKKWLTNHACLTIPIAYFPTPLSTSMQCLIVMMTCLTRVALRVKLNFSWMWKTYSNNTKVFFPDRKKIKCNSYNKIW
jgi:hypothetical protein